MSDSFYRAFENKLRGSRELIKSRLQIYLPFVQPLLKAYPAGKALDVGCGRGEWLELIGEQGFDALGVDLDESMLLACREKNLSVETADAVFYMKG
ncbi:MAG: methyltransferase domain-containing protein, partial [Burkholderiaceae bacterium]|nr:methyltransferase domain-containing protein [Burkholderiaceae bacterium]